MDTFTADYLANLTADLTAQLLNAAGRRLRQSLQGTEGEQALGRAVQAGVVALMATASATQPEEIDLLEEIFTRFLSEPDVVLELSMLLRGTALDTETLSELFAEAGFDSQTLPDLDFEQGLAAFEAAFLLAAAAEPTLQDTVATGQLLEQTSLQSQMLVSLRDMVGLLQRAGDRSITVQRGEVIARGGSVAGGSESINVGGSVYGGITMVHQHIEADKPDFTRTYCEALRQRCNVLPIAALGGEEGADDEITLDQVYIALDTKTTVSLEKGEKGRTRIPEGMGREERQLSALEAATRSPRLALLGDPGSGKSTFVRQLAARLATAYLSDKTMQSDWEPGLLPVLVTLRELAARLARLELAGLSHDETERQFVEAVWEQWRHDLKYETRVEGFAEDLKKALRQGEVVLIFDGLDEVALALRQRVRRALVALQHHYPQAQRQIVTCRVRSYTGSAVLPGFDAHTLAPFDEGKIRDFVTAWYTAQARLGRVKQDQVDKRTKDLQSAALSDDLREMASNPMLLTTMAIIHQRDIGLPKERVRLYNEAVKVLIGRWQKHKGIAPLEVLAPVLSDDLKLRQILERIAYEAHLAQSTEGPDARLSRVDLLTLLEKRQYLGDMSCAVAFLDYVDQRAGLLVGYGGDEESEHPLTYDFAHRSFQEYLAGRYMVGQGQPARFYWQRVEEGDFWYQAAMYGAEDLLFNRQLPHALLNLAYRLCPASAEPEQEGDWRALVWSGQMAALLDVEAVRADDQDKDGGARYVERLLKHLQDVLKQGRLSPIERAEAGKALAALGDPRPGVGLKQNLPDIIWSELIEPGPFTMGNTQKTDEMAFDDEEPQFECSLIEQRFHISRYPITVLQYRAFIEAGGYKQRRYWTETGWKWKAREDVKEPRDFGEPFNLSNHPQVGVSWYESVAFCNWLAEQTGQDITLPTEAQWERAARHTDARRYPWGEDQPKERCNMSDTGIGSTCAVGMFPQGDAICGAADMSGNVWEWCSTKWQGNYQNYEQEVDVSLEDDYTRVVRGGAFGSSGWYVRCAVPSRQESSSRYWHYGFRVVFSPSTSDH